MLDIAKPVEKLLGIDFESTIAPLIASDSPPAWLTTGLSVIQTEYGGMPVYVLASPGASGEYVVAIHGGAYVAQPTLLHWLAYTDLAQRTDATVVVPIYQLAPQGTAATQVPSVAGLISSEIAAHGASNVSVYGDSAGGGLALAAVQHLAGEGHPVPARMVLVSPWLDATLNNPNIGFVDDPVLNQAELQHDGLLWAGGLSATDPLVSPVYGSLEGLPRTYVYSGSAELLAPDVLLLQQQAIAQDAPISFILRNGEIHDWAFFPFLDGAQVQDQIYQQLGLVDPSAPALSGDPGIVDALRAGLQNLGTELFGGCNLAGLSTDVARSFSAMSTEVSQLWSALSAMGGDALAPF